MQAMVPHTATPSNAEFLQAIFGDRWQHAYVTGFTEDPATLAQRGLNHYWGGWIWQANPVETPGDNNFFTISTFGPDPETGRYHRRKANFEGGYCLMIDDIGGGIGSKISAVDMLSFGPPPSWILETSPDNFQYGYIFDGPCLERARVEALLNGLVDLDLIGGTDPGMLGVTRYARLPVGSNTKEKYGIPYPHRMTLWRPERRYSIDAIATAFGFDLIAHTKDDQNFGDILPPEDDLVYRSLKRLGLIKGVNRKGIYDMTCPWLHEHSDGLDNGAAYLAPMGFKCHHGHCASRKGGDLLNYIHGADPLYAKELAEALPFVPHEEISEKQGDTLPSEIVALRASEKPELEKVIAAVVPVDKPSFEAALRALALAWPDLDPWERDKYEYDIKMNAGTRIGVVRDSFKAMQKEVRLELKRVGMAREPIWEHMTNDKPIALKENIQALCDFYGIRLEYNQMSHKPEMIAPGIEFDEEERDNLNLSYIRDRMQEHGMPYARAGEFMLQLASDNEYHPFVRYLDDLDNIKVDPMFPMFNKVLATLKVSDVEEQEHAVDFVRRWFISNIAAVRGHGGIGMKGVLTLSGPQSIGKTSWFRLLYPKGMFCEGLVLDTKDKDSMIKATSHVCCELGEIEATFNRNVPSLKAFLTNQTDEIRHPYAAKSSVHPRRTVFCGTVNSQEFLIDQTGNSRFWPIEVVYCDLIELQRMRNSGELDIFWAEIDEMYRCAIQGRTEFRWWFTQEETDIIEGASERFVHKTAGEEALIKAFDFDGPNVHWMTTAEIMDVLGFDVTLGHYKTRRDEVLSAVRRLTGVRERRSFRREGRLMNGYMMPQRTIEKQAAQLTVVPPTMPFESAPEGTFNFEDFL